MRFTIERSSSAASIAPPPLPEAIRNPAIDPMDYNWSNAAKQWVIDIADMDGLLALAQNEELIVSAPPDIRPHTVICHGYIIGTPADTHPHIVIYDDYRE